MPTIEQMLTGKIHDPLTVVRLLCRAHHEYRGPVYRWAGRYWISYQNRPVEVLFMVGDGWQESLIGRP